MKKIINLLGDIFYMQDGLLHNEIEPAIKYKNGSDWWFFYGKLHKINGPAIESNKNINEYWVNGELAEEEQIKNIKRNKWIDEIL